MEFYLTERQAFEAIDLALTIQSAFEDDEVSKIIINGSVTFPDGYRNTKSFDNAEFLYDKERSTVNGNFTFMNNKMGEIDLHSLCITLAYDIDNVEWWVE